MASLVFVLWVTLVIAIGAGLIAAGVRGRYHGQMAHCGVCGYNLTGVFDRCPECGTAFVEKAVVIGERKRRPVMIVLGLAIFFFGGLPLFEPIRQINWYQWSPEFIVLSNLRSSDTSVAQRALSETKSRLQSNTFSSFEGLGDTCLAEQGVVTLGPIGQDLIKMLGQFYVSNQLTASQEKQYVAQMIKVFLVTRPRVVLGDPIPCRFSYDFRNGGAPIRSTFLSDEWEANGKPLGEKIDIALEETGESGRHSDTRRLKATTPGSIEVVVKARLRLYSCPLPPGNSSSRWDDAEARDKLWGPAIHQQMVELRATTMVLASEPADYIKTVRDGSVDQIITQISSGYKLDVRRGRNSGWKVWGYTSQNSGAHRLPTHVVADVFALIDGKEYPFGEMIGRKNTAPYFSFDDLAYSGELSETIDLVIRSNRQKARETVDMFEMWQGEVVVPDVPLKIEQPLP